MHPCTADVFHWCQNSKISLYPSGVVVADITADHADQLLLICETVSVIPFPLQNTPEALYGPVIDAMGDSGHTLCHTGLLQLVVEGAVCVLESSTSGCSCLYFSFDFLK